MIKDSKKLESYVQYVYETLLNLKDEGIVVSSNAILKGRSGAQHEIDVYYQFERSEILHKVAFECKFTGRRVEKSAVIDFHGKLQDIGNIQGIVVSKSGYQKGAKEYADHYGIRLLVISDLPELHILVGKTLAAIALPDEKCVGEPFWILMETENGTLSGNYWTMKHGMLKRKTIIPLFISKLDAECWLSELKDANEYVVRGIPQRTLGFIISTSKMAKGKVDFSLVINGKDKSGTWPGIVVSPEAIESRFLLKKFNATTEKNLV